MFWIRNNFPDLGLLGSKLKLVGKYMVILYIRILPSHLIQVSLEWAIAYIKGSQVVIFAKLDILLISLGNVFVLANSVDPHGMSRL